MDNININNLISDLEKNNILITYMFFGFKIIDKNNNKIFIDMFKFIKKDNMILQTSASNDKWPKENYYNDEVFPIKISQFNNINIPSPNKPYDFCKRVFSDNFMDIFYIHIPHRDMFLKNIIDGIGIFLISKEKFLIKNLN